MKSNNNFNGEISSEKDQKLNSDDNKDVRLILPRLFTNFLDRNLDKFSPLTQNLIGIGFLALLFIVVVHLFCAPYIVKGKLFIKDSQDVPKRVAKKYVIEISNESYLTNNNGSWIIPIRCVIPHKCFIGVYTEKGKFIDFYTFIGSWPIVNAILPSEYNLVIHNYRDDNKIELLTAKQRHFDFRYVLNLFFGSKTAYAQEIYQPEPWQIVPTIVHLEGIGDISCIDGDWCGTKGEKRRLEGFSIKKCPEFSGRVNLKYKGHIEGGGDTDWMNEGDYCGTKEKGKRLEGFAIRLEGPEANLYNVLYKAHIEGKGDTDTFMNGNFVGTRGESRRIEAIKVWFEKR